MQISKEEIIKIASLARIGLTEEEIIKMQKELSVIINYVKILEEIKGENSEERIKNTLIEEVTREDIVEKASLRTHENLIKAAPQIEKNYFKVKSIFKK